MQQDSLQLRAVKRYSYLSTLFFSVDSVFSVLILTFFS
jgi:hypothetical protein